MEPAFYRGDLLFLTNPPNERYHTGDITVYRIPGADIPIVHRVLETHDDKVKDKQFMLTKGDNNYVDDLELYQGLKWLEPKHIVGKVRGCAQFLVFPGFCGWWDSFDCNRFLPYIGYVTIAMVCPTSHILTHSLLTGIRLIIERFPAAQVCITRRSRAFGTNTTWMSLRLPNLYQFLSRVPWLSGV